MKKIILAAIVVPFLFPAFAFAQCPPNCTVYPAPTDPGFSTDPLTPTGSVDVTNQLSGGNSAFTGTTPPATTPTTTTPTTSTGLIKTSSFKDFTDSIVSIITKSIVPILITIGVIFFIWSLARFILRADNPVERAKARNYMIWSIIGLTLVFSLWTVAAIVRNTFFGSGGSLLPQFPESQGQTSTTVIQN